jgi:hypothetical protein
MNIAVAQSLILRRRMGAGTARLSWLPRALYRSRLRSRRT